MRKCFLILPLILLIAASGCTYAAPEVPAAPATPRVSVSPKPEPPPPSDEPESVSPEPTPSMPTPPEPPTIDQAARLYTWFLDGKICGYVGDYEQWITQELSLGQGDPHDTFYVRDLTGDGVPELYARYPGVYYIWSIVGGRVTAIETLVTYETIIANGGIFYHRSGGTPERDDYMYKGLSPESRKFPDVTFSVYHEDDLGRPQKVYLIGHDEVTEAEWHAVADVYLALRDEVPDKWHTAVAFSDWVEAHAVPRPFKAIANRP